MLRFLFLLQLAAASFSQKTKDKCWLSATTRPIFQFKDKCIQLGDDWALTALGYLVNRHANNVYSEGIFSYFYVKIDPNGGDGVDNCNIIPKQFAKRFKKRIPKTLDGLIDIAAKFPLRLSFKANAHELLFLAIATEPIFQNLEKFNPPDAIPKEFFTTDRHVDVVEDEGKCSGLNQATNFTVTYNTTKRHLRATYAEVVFGQSLYYKRKYEVPPFSVEKQANEDFEDFKTPRFRGQEFIQPENAAYASKHVVDKDVAIVEEDISLLQQMSNEVYEQSQNFRDMLHLAMELDKMGINSCDEAQDEHECLALRDNYQNKLRAYSKLFQKLQGNHKQFLFQFDFKFQKYDARFESMISQMNEDDLTNYIFGTESKRMVGPGVEKQNLKAQFEGEGDTDVESQNNEEDPYLSGYEEDDAVYKRLQIEDPAYAEEYLKFLKGEGEIPPG